MKMIAGRLNGAAHQRRRGPGWRVAALTTSVLSLSLVVEGNAPAGSVAAGWSKAVCQQHCSELGDPDKAPCERYRMVMPFPKVQHACEEGLEMGKENGCMSACGLPMGQGTGKCDFQRDEIPRPQMYQACKKGLMKGASWAKKEFKARYFVVAKKNAAPKVSKHAKKFRTKKGSKAGANPWREKFREWILKQPKFKTAALLKLGKIEEDGGQDAQIQRIEDTFMVFKSMHIDKTAIEAASHKDLLKWNGMLHYPLTYDGEGGEDLEEEDLRGQLSEVLPMVEKLGQAPTGPWAKGGAR